MDARTGKAPKDAPFGFYVETINRRFSLFTSDPQLHRMWLEAFSAILTIPLRPLNLDKYFGRFGPEPSAAQRAPPAAAKIKAPAAELPLPAEAPTVEKACVPTAVIVIAQPQSQQISEYYCTVQPRAEPKKLQSKPVAAVKAPVLVRPQSALTAVEPFRSGDAQVSNVAAHFRMESAAAIPPAAAKIAQKYVSAVECSKPRKKVLVIDSPSPIVTPYVEKPNRHKMEKQPPRTAQAKPVAAVATRPKRVFAPTVAQKVEVEVFPAYGMDPPQAPRRMAESRSNSVILLGPEDTETVERNNRVVFSFPF